MPRETWEGQLAQAPEHNEVRHRFMTEGHHRVRRFAVSELPRWGRPISPSEIADGVGLPVGRTSEILAELEENLFYLVRNDSGDVEWAFPVTVAETPHRLVFSTGERLFGA
jgi:hypothetical protein